MRMHEKIAPKRNRFGIWGRFRVIHVKKLFSGTVFPLEILYLSIP